MLSPFKIGMTLLPALILMGSPLGRLLLAGRVVFWS